MIAGIIFGAVVVCLGLMILGMTVFIDHGTSPGSSEWKLRWYFVATILWGVPWLGLALYFCVLLEKML